MPNSKPYLSRRLFLAGAGALTIGAVVPGMAFAKTGAAPRLVVVILRGALDGLSAIPPYADSNYAALHKELAIDAPGASQGALALDDTFGLHPSLKFLHERYQAGELIALHAIASAYRDRSHFDGQAVLENGLTHALGSADGWLNRALQTMPARLSGAESERALALSQNVPLILRGSRQVLSKSPQTTTDLDEDLAARLADLYSKDDWFSARLSEALQGEHMTGSSASTAMQNHDGGQHHGDSRLNHLARMAAAIMNSDGGPEIAVLEANGWDTHFNQGAAQGALANRLSGLDEALRTLATGLAGIWASTAVMIVTEFGRTAAMNGTRGTDHGTGTCCFLVGGAVRGGRVVADWPGLAPHQLLENRDLRPTQDLRSVFKAVLTDHLRIDRRRLEASVFPDSGSIKPLPGLMRA